MARIKKYAPDQKLTSFQTLILDESQNSDYFRITEFKDTFTGGKNGFLIEGSQHLKESTEIKIELLDVEGNPIYFEPGNGIPEYYEGISKLIAVYIYNDTPIGLGKITVLGELKQYEENGVIRDIPDNWKGAYNVKWERTFQINKALPNEDKVRFYRRPNVVIDEIIKPIFSGKPPSVTQTGSVDGIPLVPNENTNLSNFSLPANYRLNVNSGNKWTGSIVGETITFDDITYSPIVDEVVSETEIIVSPPYTENNIVKSFTNKDYSVEFPYIEGFSDLATALTGSFAKISITDMKTFVGDAARVKVFRRSQSNLTDFEFVQEIQLESNELLRDITTFAKKEEPYGFFSQPVIEDYWVTSSNDFDVTLNQNFLYNSAKLDSTPTNYFFTSESFAIQSGVEYTLDFNVRKETTDVNAYLKVFLSGSYNGRGVTQEIVNVPSSTFILQKTNFSENIVANNFNNAKLYFEVSGSDWYVNNVSVKASQETSFSPDEITFIQQVPKTLVEETFDYRFEFYDINNNYIPLFVEDTKTFTGGNTNLFKKSIELTPNNLYFSFDSASNPANAVPPFIINIDVETTLVTGSITYTSGAYDFEGRLLSSSQYTGGTYPGYLTNWNVDSGNQPFLRVADFTGSRNDIPVQFISYTGAIEGVSDSFIITRVEDGKGGVSFEIVPYRGVQIKNKESKTLEIQAVRVDGINRIDLRAGLDRGFSDAKLHLLSSSISNNIQTYVSLSQAITNPNFIEGVSAGTTGSGEIDYNAIFNRDSIDNELTVFLMDGPTTESILTSQILTDLKDGLNPGLITSTADQFNIRYKPREAFSFDPSQIIVTSSFQQRGSTLNPLSASLVIKPSASIATSTELPELFVFYDTGAFDDTITVAVTDFAGNSINSGVPGGSVAYYTATQTKQLNLEFTYTEPITSASVTANKSFFITPDGLPGQDAIVIDIDPNPIALGSNHKGEVSNYSLANTDVQITQGDLFLINTASGNPGTFTTTSIVPTNITYGTLVGDSTTTMSLAGFDSMTALSASLQYNFNVYPYFTASLVTASKVQKFTKLVDGGGPIEVTLDPLAYALNADEVGFVTNYGGAATDVSIKQNDDYFFYDEFDGGRPGTFVTSSIVAPNIQFSEMSSSFDDLSVSGSISSSGGEVLHFKGFYGLTNSQPSASIVYNFKVYPYSLTNGVAGVPRIVSKTQTFSKVSDGTAARKVSLVANSDVVVYNGDGIKVAPPGDVTLSATAINVTGSAFFKFLNNDGSTIQASSTDSTHTVSDLPTTGSSKTFTVELRDGLVDGNIVDTDSVTISGIGEGSTAYTSLLSNPAASVLVEIDGTKYFENTPTLIRAYKGGTELQFVEVYDEEAVDPGTFLPIGTFGQFSASIHQISTYITHDGDKIDATASQLYGTSDGIDGWTAPQQNTTGFIIFRIDFENGRGEQFIQQSFSTVFEGATGPGIVMRGEWNDGIEYIFNAPAKRRDSVFRNIGSDVHYWATTEGLTTGSEYTDGDAVYTLEPDYTGPPSEGDIDTGGWQYLGQQDFFVAAKLAIFEESFVKETINVGIPTPGSPNAQIAIVGGSDEPYITIGQSGTQGYGQTGVFLGMTNNGGDDNNSTSGILSLTSDTGGGTYNQLAWDGDTLLIKGAIRQTSEGVVESRNLGLWSAQPDGTQFRIGDIVAHNNITWEAIAVVGTAAPNSHIKGNTPYTGDTEPSYSSTKWQESNLAAQSLRLSATSQTFRVAQNGTVTPETITITANRENIAAPTTFTTNPTPISTGGSGDELTITYVAFSQNGAHTNNTITATAGSITDEITIVELREGTDGITVINSNQSHTLPADNAGGVSDFAGSGTTITAYEGATQLTYDDSSPYASGSFRVTPVIVPTGAFIHDSISIGSNYYQPEDGNTMSADNVTITYTLVVTKSNGTTVNVDSIQTLTKARTGAAGGGVQFAYLNNDVVTTPTTPTAIGTDDWTGSPTGVSSAVPYEWFSQRTSINGAYGNFSIPALFTNFAEDGGPGAAGAGVVYRGAWESGVEYFKTTTRTDVVKGSNDEYWIATTTHTSADIREPDDGANHENYWSEFGATFDSVATDILFATDVYADQTINVGSSGSNPVIALNADAGNASANPFISIGQTEQLYRREGLYMGFASGSPVFSIENSGSYMRYDTTTGLQLNNLPFLGTGSIIEGASIRVGRNEGIISSEPGAYNFTVSPDGIVSASEAFIQGEVQATSGRIGEWVIDANTKAIRDSNSEIVLDPGVGANTPEIQLWNGTITTNNITLNQGSDSGTAVPSTTQATVTFANGGFVIEGTGGAPAAGSQQPDLNLTLTSFLLGKPGTASYPNTDLQLKYYELNLVHTSLSGKKFLFSTTQDGTHAGGSEFNQPTSLGVQSPLQSYLIQSSSAAPGTAGAFIRITPSSSMGSGDNALYYYDPTTPLAGGSVNLQYGGYTEDIVEDLKKRVSMGASSTLRPTTSTPVSLTWATDGLILDTDAASSTTEVSSTVISDVSDAQTIVVGANNISGINVNQLQLTGVPGNCSHTVSQPTTFQPYIGQINGGIEATNGGERGSKSVTVQAILLKDGTEVVVGSNTLVYQSIIGGKDQVTAWVGVSSYQPCVIGTTNITLPDGTTKLAKDIVVGESILSWNPFDNIFSQAVVSEIISKSVSSVYEVTVDGNVIEVSDTHTFWLFGSSTTSGQINVETLYKHQNTNPEIWVKDGDTIKKSVVTYVRKIIKDADVFTFSVPVFVNYISNDIISHNVEGGPGGTTWDLQYFSSATSAGSDVTSTALSSADTTIISNFAGSVNGAFRVIVTAKATKSMTVSAQGGITYSYSSVATNFGIGYQSGANNCFFNDSTPFGTPSFAWALAADTLFSEIQPAGIQVVSADNRFVRMEVESTAVNPNLLHVKDGYMTVESDQNVTTNDSIRVRGNIRPMQGNTNDLGTSTYRWKTIYSQNALNSSDRNQKKNILDSDLGLLFVNQLNPIKYHWLNDSITSPYHYGLIAQDVDDVISTGSAAFVNEESGSWSMAYQELISPMIKAIQELSTKVSQLEAQISGSE